MFVNNHSDKLFSNIFVSRFFFFLGFMSSVETIKYWKMDWCVVDFGLSIGTVNNNKKIDTRFILFFSPISYMIVCECVSDRLSRTVQ